MEKKQDKHTENNSSLEELVKHYLDSNPILKDNNKTKELEVRFGTSKKATKKISKIDYNNVVQFLYSCGFKTENNEGLQILRIQNQFVNPKDGRTILSNIRAEIVGSDLIQEYCKTNSIQKVLDIPSTTFEKLKFTLKSRARDKDDVQIPKAFMDDFNCSATFQNEIDFHIYSNTARNIISKWEDSLKVFRCLNRVRFYHENYPIFVDISIVKTSKTTNYVYIPKYTIQEAGVFENVETYEIELEIDNNRVGNGTSYNTPQLLLANIKKCIRIVLSGIQKTKFPISYVEYNDVLKKYLTLIHGEEHSITRIKPFHFIGPSQLTLQLENVSEDTEDSIVPNIRTNYTVTEKADGLRYLMYIDENGKIYFIDTNMNVIFTGTFTKEKAIFNSLIDGEYVEHNKEGQPIRLFLAFDIYIVNNINKMNLPFKLTNNEENQNKYRLSLLNQFAQAIKPYSILDYKKKSEVVAKTKTFTDFRVQCKTFYDSSDSSIFTQCSKIMSNITDKAYEYETDGLIFTPSNLFVGSNNEDEKMDIKTKITWKYCMKWKPVEFNTIDFLVTIKKDSVGKDEVHNIYEEGQNYESLEKLVQYKTLILNCGYDEKDGYINPVQNVYNDELPTPDQNENNEKYKAKPFHPTEPYDPEAHLCNIYLKNDGQQLFMTTEDGDYFEENMIVEFKYIKENKKGWNWVPIRVRYDKTSDLRNNGKNFGNSFKTANSNWYSIHNPVTTHMISTGEDIPTNNNEEVYYNTINDDETNTGSLRNFHNLYIKSKLIQNVSSPGNLLIDYSVGKAGDFSKWIKSKLRFVFGIDVSSDNIANRINGACARYLNNKKKFHKMPSALFVTGNSTKNIKDGSCFEKSSEKEKLVANCLFGKGAKDEVLLGKGVYKHYGIAEKGFHISSCQFSIHYFFEHANVLHQFLRNIAECTKLHGYFIATCYDGNKVFNLLKKKQNGEAHTIMKNGKKIFEITKRYDASSFPDDQLSLGYGIDVYQESINKTFKEYLVNFTFFKRLMENYGFIILPDEEAKSMNFTNGSDLFETLFQNMQQEINENKKISANYRTADKMSSEEKQISFLNRYYIFKKVRNVDAKKIESVMSFATEEEEEDSRPPSPDGTPPQIQIERAKNQANVPKATGKKIVLKSQKK